MNIDQRLQVLHNELKHLLEPFDWKVERVDRDEGYWINAYTDRALTTFRFAFYVRNQESVLSGCKLEWGQTIAHAEGRHYVQNDRYWEQLPFNWVRGVLYQAVLLVDKKRLVASEIDWRPAEMIPEDYYSA